MTKKQLRAHLEAYELTAIAELAAQRGRVLSHLVGLTYEGDLLIAWRAIEAFGLAAAAAADRDPEFVRGHLRRLLWLLSDESGGICWHAPELIGEVLHRRPTTFAPFAPPLIAVLDLEAEDAPRFRAGALWGIGRVAERAPELLGTAIPLVTPCLDDPDPQVRGQAAVCLGRLGHGEILAQRPRLLADEGNVMLYRDGGLTVTTVGQLAREAVAAR